MWFREEYRKVMSLEGFGYGAESVENMEGLVFGSI